MAASTYSYARRQLGFTLNPEEPEQDEQFCFYLGTHHPHWLATAKVPLFISYHRLLKRSSVPLASCKWALDSGGFTELSQHGEWRFTAKTYAEDVQWLQQEIGRMQFAAVQDWIYAPTCLTRICRRNRPDADEYAWL